MFRAAAAKRVITPPAGTTLAGYRGRVEAAEGTHDDLYVRVLLVEDGSRLAAFAIADVFAFDAVAAGRVRDRLADLGLDPAYVMVAATHSHAGPAGLTAPHDDDVLSVIVEGTAEAVSEAGARLGPVTPMVGVGLADAVAANRRRRDGPADDRVCVLRFQSLDERPVAAFINFACHPTVLGRDNRMFSADYPGAAVAHFEVALALMGVPNPEDMGSAAFMALFTNGACGDVSTRFTRRATTFAEAEMLGSRVAEAAWSAWETAISLQGDSIAALQRVVSLPARMLPTEADAAAALAEAEAALDEGRAAEATAGDLRVLETAVEGARHTLAMIAEGFEPADAVIQGIRIGDCVVLGLPFAVFSELGQRIRGSVPTPVIVVGFANDWLGYLPTPTAYPEGGYEVGFSRFGPEAADFVVEQCAELIREVLTS